MKDMSRFDIEHTQRRLRKDVANKCNHFVGAYVDDVIKAENFDHWLDCLIYDLKNIQEQYRVAADLLEEAE